MDNRLEINRIPSILHLIHFNTQILSYLCDAIWQFAEMLYSAVINISSSSNNNKLTDHYLLKTKSNAHIIQNVFWVIFAHT